MLSVSRLLVHILALCVVDDGQGNLLQNRRQWSIFIESAPPSHPSSLPNQVLVLLWYTDWDDVWLKDDRLVESEKRQVILERFGVELLVGDHDGHLPVLECVGFGGGVVQVELSHSQQQLVRLNPFDAVSSGDGPVLV